MFRQVQQKTVFAFAIVGVIALLAFSQRLRAEEPDKLVTVRKAPAISGRVEGTVQQLNAINVKVESSGVITGDLLVPGTPSFSISSTATYGGTVVGTGSATPTGYTVTLNGSAAVRHVVTRTDPVTLETVNAPAD